MRKPAKKGPLDLGWEGPYKLEGFRDGERQVAVLSDANGKRWTRPVTHITRYREPGAAGRSP